LLPVIDNTNNKINTTIRLFPNKILWLSNKHSTTTKQTNKQTNNNNFEKERI